MHAHESHERSYTKTCKSYSSTFPVLFSLFNLFSSVASLPPSLTFWLPLLLTAFSLSLTLQCATLSTAAAVHDCAAHRRAWSPPVISSHCPCAVICTKEHGLWEGGEREGRERWMMEKGGWEGMRQRVRDGWRRWGTEWSSVRRPGWNYSIYCLKPTVNCWPVNSCGNKLEILKTAG